MSRSKRSVRSLLFFMLVAGWIMAGYSMMLELKDRLPPFWHHI